MTLFVSTNLNQKHYGGPPVHPSTLNVHKYSAVIGQCIRQRRVQQATGNDHLNSFPVTCLLVRLNSSIKLQHRLYSNITTICQSLTGISNTDETNTKTYKT